MWELLTESQFNQKILNPFIPTGNSPLELFLPIFLLSYLPLHEYVDYKKILHAHLGARKFSKPFQTCTYSPALAPLAEQQQKNQFSHIQKRFYSTEFPTAVDLK